MALFTRYELKEFDTSTLSDSFQDFGMALSNPAIHAEFINTSTVDVYVSIDGSTNTFRIPAEKSVPIPSSPRNNNDGSFVFTKGTQLQVKQVDDAAAGTLIAHIFT